MNKNSTERFLRALYEKAGDGALSITFLRENSPPITRWFTKDQISEMAAYAVNCGRKYNTCLNINPRVSPIDEYHREQSEDVLEVVAIYVILSPTCSSFLPASSIFERADVAF